MSQETLTQIRAMLDELKEAARTGSMIPVRVPGQIDAILALLDGLETAQAAAAPADAAGPASAPASAPDIPASIAEERAQTSELLSIAVHEMRVPLTSIRGYADMLDKGMLGELSDQQAQFVATIRANALRLERLIADVNDFGKIRGGRLHLDRKMDTAKNVLLMAEKRVRDLAAERRQTLTFDVPDGLPLLNVDSARIAQALAYLIENGLAYSPEGSTVTVTAQGEGATLRVAVTDQGIGMTADDLAHLGEPFWRAEHEVIRSVKGHGLGYVVAKGIIEAHGGTMFVDSVFEQGSTFGFTLPGMT
ncbi:MAG: hypothetical protein Kow0077_30080 [Anaerolineae bacterium]